MKLLPLVRRRTEKNHYDLSDANWKALARLAKTDEWKLYKSLVHRHMELLGERLLNADPARMMEARGEIKGFREAVTFVDDLLQMKGSSDARHTAESRSQLERAKRLERSGAFSPFAPVLTK
jgi:hypothetical protein